MVFIDCLLKILTSLIKIICIYIDEVCQITFELGYEGIYKRALFPTMVSLISIYLKMYIKSDVVLSFWDHQPLQINSTQGQRSRNHAHFG